MKIIDTYVNRKKFINRNAERFNYLIEINNIKTKLFVW